MCVLTRACGYNRSLMVLIVVKKRYSYHSYVISVILMSLQCIWY